MSEIWATSGDFAVLAACSMGTLVIISLWLRKRRADGWPLVLSWAAILIALAAGCLHANRAAEVERGHLRAMIEGIAPTYALQLEHLGHAGVTSRRPPTTRSTSR